MEWTEDIPLRSSGRFRDLIPVPGVKSYGTWTLFTWNNHGRDQHGIKLLADKAPWRELFSKLDDVGRSFPAEPVSVVDEADAIVACCWRYGSYAHVLTGGELYPPFAKDPHLSRLSDDEMKRIHLEFSSGLAEWLRTRSTDPATIRRRVQAALHLLPLPWKDNKPERRITSVDSWISAWLRMVDSAAAKGLAVPAAMDAWTVRQEANAAINWAYRGQAIVEDLHAGAWSTGREIPGFVRLYKGETDRICRNTARQMAIFLSIREVPGDYEVFKLGMGGSPRNWSLTEETSPVEYLRLPDAGRLYPRVCWLAKRWPQVYGGADSI